MCVHCPVDEWTSLQQYEAHERANGNDGNSQWRDARSKPELKHRDVIPRSTLDNSERASLGDDQRDAFTDQYSFRNSEPLVASTRECAPPQVPQTTHFTQPDRTVHKTKRAHATRRLGYAV